MKIVTYTVNGLRPRIAQFGSLFKLLNSLDADVICFQETKLRWQELTVALGMAEDYKFFFSCTGTSKRRRTRYSGVATFCRLKSAFSSDKVALPVAVEESFTGVLNSGKGEMIAVAEGLEEFSKDELLKVDGKGQCVITDHGHFEEKHTHAGHVVQVLKSLVMALESTAFFVQGHALTKSRTCKVIIL